MIAYLETLVIELESGIMSSIDEVLVVIREFPETFSGKDLLLQPPRKLAVVACMDYRISIERVLGLKHGDANIIRNAGGIITEDALRSLIISHHLLGVQEVMIINHTKCGMLTVNEKDILKRLHELSGLYAV